MPGVRSNGLLAHEVGHASHFVAPSGACGALFVSAADFLALTLVGGTIPKALVGVPRVGNSSAFTTIPRATQIHLGLSRLTPSGAALRATGRLFSPLWVGYGVWLATAEAGCAAGCAAGVANAGN